MQLMTPLWVALIAIFCGGISPAMAALPPASADDTPADSAVHAEDINGEDGDDREQSDDGENDGDRDKNDVIRSAWSRYLAAPDGHRWELEAGVGTLFVQNAYGSRRDSRLGRIRLRRLWWGPLATSLGLEATRLSSPSDAIEFQDGRMALSSAVGAHWWNGRWLLGADLEGGAIWQRRTIADGQGQQVSSSRVKPLVGAYIRTGISIRATASASIETGLRWHPERLDRLITLQLAWLW